MHLNYHEQGKILLLISHYTENVLYFFEKQKKLNKNMTNIYSKIYFLYQKQIFNFQEASEISKEIINDANNDTNSYDIVMQLCKNIKMNI